MDRNLRDRWCAALRSGKYKQGKGYLHQGSKFCRLGVLADIEGTKWEIYDKDAIPKIYHSPYIGVESLYYEVSKNLGLNNDDPLDSNVTKLVLMNDGASKDDAEAYNLVPHKRYTFAEIADWIEKNL